MAVIWHKISASVEGAIRILGIASAFLMIPLVLVTLFDVFTRKFFTIGSTGLQEAEWHLHTLTFCGILAYVIQLDKNVRIDIFYDKLSKRRQALIDLLGYVLFALPFLATVIFFGVDFVIASYVSGEGSFSTHGIPHRWVIKSALLLAFVLMFLQVILNIVRCVRNLTNVRTGGSLP